MTNNENCSFMVLDMRKQVFCGKSEAIRNTIFFNKQKVKCFHVERVGTYKETSRLVED